MVGYNLADERRRVGFCLVLLALMTFFNSLLIFKVVTIVTIIAIVFIVAIIFIS